MGETKNLTHRQFGVSRGGLTVRNKHVALLTRKSAPASRGVGDFHCPLPRGFARQEAGLWRSRAERAWGLLKQVTR